MIQFTIKTLDSKNHHFTVDDEITVQQLKEKVREQMGIETNLQRLIFCGRVMQDDKKLSRYDIDGKVVHLVQRAPPRSRRRIAYGSSSGSAEGNGSDGDGSTSDSSGLRGSRRRYFQISNTNTDDSENEDIMQEERRRIMYSSLPRGASDFLMDHQNLASMSPTAIRLEILSRMIEEIKASLAVLRAHITGEVGFYNNC
ncbi:unnamed protein product [Diatraea saccharalis]|uniref:Ubiquitin-like domain-containing protein n=1 Tax=Diatraea saccharalis TaxID=40085 RepID=A0A9N9QTE1_9NEOP|nr:unnamed protein product [Diatraea saccharalis]